MSARDRILNRLKSRLSEGGPVEVRSAAVDERLTTPMGRAPPPPSGFVSAGGGGAHLAIHGEG